MPLIFCIHSFVTKKCFIFYATDGAKLNIQSVIKTVYFLYCIIYLWDFQYVYYWLDDDEFWKWFISTSIYLVHEIYVYKICTKLLIVSFNVMSCSLFPFLFLCHKAKALNLKHPVQKVLYAAHVKYLFSGKGTSRFSQKSALSTKREQELCTSIWNSPISPPPTLNLL